MNLSSTHNVDTTSTSAVHQELLVKAQNVRKRYPRVTALDGINLEIPAGRIVGLVGPNGAGKTTLLQALTGQIAYEGNIQVAGLDPRRQRAQLMSAAGIIQDVPVLPPWMRVKQLLRYLQGVHPGFDLARAREYLQRTEITENRKFKHLSKGMKTQLHLALVLAMDTKILFLDEPTHGLDLLFRKRFYASVLEEYFTEQKSVLIATHQIEEVEHILSDVIFIKNGRVVLAAELEKLQEQFVQLLVAPEHESRIEKFHPLARQPQLGRTAFLLKIDPGQSEELGKLGEIQRPRLADIFVALMEPTPDSFEGEGRQ